MPPSPLCQVSSLLKMWRISSLLLTTMPPGHPNLSGRYSAPTSVPDTCSDLVLSRQDYHSLMFGSGRSVASLASNVSHALCLPISLQEVLDSNVTDSSTTEVYCSRSLCLPLSLVAILASLCLSCPGVQGSMRYFLVDCRPVDHFSCGHLAKSFHLDANLVLFTFS